jgi:hypothetical protein
METPAEISVPRGHGAVALILATVGITLCSGLALGVVCLLMAIGGYRPPGTLAWIVIMLPYPAAIVGTAATLVNGRWWPFYAGLALTCLPVVLAILLAEPLPGLENGAWD